MHPNIAPKKGPNNEIHIPNTNNINAILGEIKNNNSPSTNQNISNPPIYLHISNNAKMTKITINSPIKNGPNSPTNTASINNGTPIPKINPLFFQQINKMIKNIINSIFDSS